MTGVQTCALPICGITIKAQSVTLYYNHPNGDKYQFNFIDTPGHVDFTIEVERSLRVLDGAVAVFDGVHGVEPQTETVWRQADKYRVPRIGFVNKLDRVGANYDMSVQSIKEKLGSIPLPIQVPIGKEEGFVGVVDLVEMQAYVWDLSPSKELKPYEKSEIPANLKEDAELAREAMLETLSEYDDELMEKYLDGKSLSIEEIRAAIRRACLGFKLVPVVCGSAFKNKGIELLLDAVLHYLPSPLDLPAVAGVSADRDEKPVIRERTTEAYFSALIFKIASDPFVGQLYYVRVYSGTLKVGGTVYNPRQKKRERVSKIFHMEANRREEIGQASAGDIIAIVGPKGLITGDTICDQSHPISYESLVFAEPVIYIAIEPKSTADGEKLEKAVERLVAEDPSFRSREDKDTGQNLIGGMGELHLEIIVDRLRREFNVAVNVGSPQVAYRESIGVSYYSEELFEREIAGKQQYAKIAVTLEPSDNQEQILFESAAPKNFPKLFVDAVRKGISQGLGAGSIAGFPVVGVKAKLESADFRPDASDEVSFELAAANITRRCLQEAKPKLLEPLMKVEVLVPEEYLSNVITDLNSRKAKILGIDQKANLQLISSQCALSAMFGYSTDLRSISQGRATYTMTFERYEQVSQATLEKIRPS